MQSEGQLQQYGATIISCRFGLPTMYEILVQFPSEARVVLRRYSDFQHLRDHPSLRELNLPALPPKAVPSMLSTTFREKRQTALERLLEAAVEAFPTLECDALAEFLGAEPADREAIQAGCEARLRAMSAEAGTSQALSPQTAGPPEGTVRPDAEPLPAAGPAPSSEETPGGGAEAHDAPAAGPAEFADIRELRRQRWLQQAQASGAQQPAGEAGISEARPAAPEQAVAPTPAETRAPSRAAPQELLIRVQLQPLRQLPAEHDGPQERLEVLREALSSLRRLGTTLEAGLLVKGQGFDFAVVKCTPARGSLGPDTLLFVDGPPLPVLKRLQLVGLRENGHIESEQVLLADYVAPYFRSIFADASRHAVVASGDTLHIHDKMFYILAAEPASIGIVDKTTVVFAHPDDADEFRRIHVVPFSDTLPSAYNFDVFADYVKPFFMSHVLDRFSVGQTFYHNSVQFSVVATVPQGVSCRVGRNSEIFTEGCLHPTAANLLSPDLARRLAAFPPGLQMLLLQTDLFGDGEVADRIMQAQERHSRVQQAAATVSLASRLTEEQLWSQEFRQQLPLDQTECMVCLCPFEEGERVRRLPCNHVFHTACVDEWLGRDAHCPLCRHSLRPGGRRGAGPR
mmetsp:Transcript_1851/g.5582  ORF Transcript_1851/g.5582 Transcript_1851/m.5582 type:complete len:628 (+) Transcript_1851:128-2011(+)